LDNWNFIGCYRFGDIEVEIRMIQVDFLKQYKKIGILGIARSGLAVASKLKKYGVDIFLSDSKPKESFKDLDLKKYGDGIEFGKHSEKLLQMDLLIVSPGIPNNLPILLAANKKNIPIWSEIEFAYRCTHSDSKIIAITGSNGKSTTVSIISHVLKKLKYNIILAGNTGKAYSSYNIEKKRDFIVLEISSFQLEFIDKFKPNVAAILNITPDHLDRYNSFKEYALTKFKIFQNQNEDDIKVVNNECRKYAKSLENVLYFSTKDYVLPHDCITKLKGVHNYANIQAALLCLSQYVNQDDFFKALRSFRPLEHRLESFVIIKGVEYVNDSKGTNTDSVKYALMSFDKPIHLILGGYDKGEDFRVLVEYMKNRVKKLYLIGNTATQMREIFSHYFDCVLFTSFDTAVKATIKEAVKGEIVLLSPACASYDWFKNFEERGNLFKEIVYKEGRKD